MTREIKFRAWIKDEIETGNWEMVYDLAFDESQPINELLASVDNLMQYTGLKDKNGKEIYEGDILQKWHRAIINGKIYPLAVVRWNSQTARFNGIPLTHESEVIGNIYENPELIK